MSTGYCRITYTVIVVIIGVIIVSCGQTTTEPPVNSRDTGGQSSLQKTSDIASWHIVFKDMFRDTWRFNKQSESQGFIRFQGQYIRCGNVFQVGALYNTETKIFAISVKYSVGGTEYVMIESLKFYSDGKFYGKYAYADKTMFGNDRMTITENNSAIQFKQSASGQEPAPFDIALSKLAGKTRERY